MKAYYESDLVKLYHGDCREVLPLLSFDAVVTDPPWDQAKGIPGSDDPRGLFNSVAPLITNCKLVAVQLGCYTDPCFTAPIAARMPFIHVCWLRYVPPSYNGRILVDSDVAYIFGQPPASAPGRRVLPSTCQSTGRDPSEKHFLRKHGRNRTSKQSAATTKRLDHPMPRCLKHVRWLVKWHTEQGQTVCDPFTGSGTTGVACVQSSRRFVGVEVEEKYCEIAAKRLERAAGEASDQLPFGKPPELFSSVPTAPPSEPQDDEERK